MISFHYDPLLTRPSPPRSDPATCARRGRLTLALSLGVGAPRRRKIEDIDGCLSPTDLKTYLTHARVWEVKIKFDNNENNATPGRGYCGFISMDRIIHGMDRTIGPDVTEGSTKLLNVIKILSDNSSLPLRNNWRNVIPSLHSAKELLASTDRYIRTNGSNWIALEHLPETLWLNAGVLVGSCNKWDYSRWISSGPDKELVMEECQARLSPRVSLSELRKAVSGKMLCFNSVSKHFFTRHEDMSAEFDLLATEAVNHLIETRFPGQPFLPDPHPPAVSSASMVSDEDEGLDNLAVPVSKWDGLITAELILRPNNDHRILDLSNTEDRSKMASAIREMTFLDAHDAHSIAESLDSFSDGLLPDAPKMSIAEMEAVCIQTNTKFKVVDSDSTSTIVESDSLNIVIYDWTSNHYSLNTASPLPTSPSSSDSLVAINWNCNSWDFHKAQKIAALADSQKADAILLTDTRIDAWRTKTAVDQFAKTLQKATGKIWEGLASPKHPNHRVGGFLIMHSNRISKSKIKEIMPLGVLSSLEGSWNNQDFCLLSVYRPPEENDKVSLLSLASL